MARLIGKVAIVTGGGSGIGEAICRRFASEGARIVIADIDGAAGARVADSLREKHGADAHAIVTDVADKESVRALVEATVERIGAPDILVNNAGIAIFSEPLEITDDQWTRCLAVNLEGAWRCCRTVLPYMLEAGSGTIINIISNHASQVIRKTFPYPVAKHGLLGLTRALALEYADRNIAVNAISPGYIATPLTERLFQAEPDPAAARRLAEESQPVRRLGTAEEVAAVAALLASDEARFMIGSNILIDGGVSIQMYE